MNDFIVWDNESEIFIDETKCILADGTLFRNEKDFANEISDDLSMFFDIGLKDINGKSIYANCSIFEFDYLVDIENEIFQKRIGIFYFEKTFLAYHISFLTRTNRKGGNADNYNAFGMKNFKIIDTIQQNKLGLIK